MRGALTPEGGALNERRAMKLPKAVMTVEEFAEFALMHEETVRRKCREGEIPAMKAGKRWAVFAQEYADEAERRRKGDA